MGQIRIVWGIGNASTEKASYDAALAAANVHNYNLVSVSSVIPSDAALEVIGTAPDLGTVGDRLTVVQSRKTVKSGETAAAGIGWARSKSGRGIFYESTGDTENTVRERIKTGLTAGKDHRDWEFLSDGDEVVAEADPDVDNYATAVVLAIYGRSSPIL
jgi:arginine decarboxylase